MKKGQAFCFTTVVMALLCAAAIMWPDRAGNIIGMLSVIAGFGTCYIGLQVCDNGVKGKYFNEAMADFEYKKQEGKKL